MAEEQVIANQESILKNQNRILANQTKIVSNQTKVFANQAKIMTFIEFPLRRNRIGAMTTVWPSTQNARRANQLPHF